MLETITGNFVVCFHANEQNMKLPVILVVISLVQPAHLAVVRNVRTAVKSEYIGKYQGCVCLSAVADPGFGQGGVKNLFPRFCLRNKVKSDEQSKQYNISI